MVRIDRAFLDAQGFQGFLPLQKLRADPPLVPNSVGVYAILWTGSDLPFFWPQSPAGWFKGRDPSYSSDILRDKWIPTASVIYIGKAGPSPRRTLRKRINELVRFGSGDAIAHRGGRALWHVRDIWGCLLAWSICRADPRGREKVLLAAFERSYGKLPFANFRH